MIYNGVDLSQWFRVNVGRSLLPDVEVETIDMPGGGARFRSARLMPLVIDVKMRLKSNSFASMPEMRHAVAAALNATEPKRLELPDEPGLYYMALPYGATNLDRNLKTGAVSMRFIAPDPAAYGAARTAAVGTGISTIHIGGNHPATPILSAVGAERDESTGLWGVLLDEMDAMYVPMPTSGAHAVEIDCAERTVKVDGAVAMITLQSDWWELPPGSHTARVAQGSGGASVSWTERWL